MNKDELKYLLQKFGLKHRDDNFYKIKIEKLRDKIIKETGWLVGTTYSLGKMRGLAFHEQAIKYYEYKNMVIQRRAQYVIIFLTFALLVSTGLQIYLNFFK